MVIFQLLIFAASLFALYRGAAFVVDYSSKLAVQYGITPIVIGLTIVAFGTSAPELAASLAAAFENRPDLITGNVVGSNIANIALIMGLAALLRPVKVHSRTLRREIPFLVVASVLFFLFALDGSVSRIEGLSLVVLAVLFNVFLIHQARKEKVFDEAIAQLHVEHSTQKRLYNVTLILVGIALLVAGARYLVSSSTALAVQLGVSEAVIGIVLVAIGTSLPELVTSLVASFRRNNELVVGNVVGSNILNIFLIVGITAVLIPIHVNSLIQLVDLPVMLFFTFLFVGMMRTKYMVTRSEGALLLLGYGAYIVFVISR